jgi:hypothetical protein
MARLVFKDVFHEMYEDEQETHEYQFQIHNNDYGNVDHQMIQGLVDSFFRGMKSLNWEHPVLFIEILERTEEYVREMQDIQTINQKRFKLHGYKFYNDYNKTLEKLSALFDCFLSKKELLELNKKKEKYYG